MTNTNVASIDYSPYGHKLRQTGTVQPTFGYAGMMEHQPSGLNLTWYRGYDAKSGRWLSEDPIGFNGGVNLYGYVGGDVVNYFDPLGLYTEVTIWRGVGLGSSSFGHVSTNINNRNYSLGPGGWDTKFQEASKYNKRQTEFRGGKGIILNLTSKQETALTNCLNNPREKYNAISNNCGAAIQECLKSIGVDIGNSILPNSILENLKKSPSNIGSTSYPEPRGSSSPFVNTIYWR